MLSAPSIDDLLAGHWRDPATGQLLRLPVRLPVRRIAIEPTLDGQEAALIAPLGLGRRLAVVSDRNTYEALGRRVGHALAGIATIDEVVLDEPHADLATAQALAAPTRSSDGIVAVGSGTINDLCKHLAYTTGRAYAVFATAPSMNGYVTATASLASDGLKSSLPARPPVAALFDLEVLRRAPQRLIRAGLGDAICRTTAQTDWLLAHLLRDTPYTETPFRLQAADEAALFEAAGSLRARDSGAIGMLTRLLVLGGLGMCLAGGSQPASQAEHLISHYLEMMTAANGRAFHGEQVGVATLTISRLQHRLLDAAQPPRLGPTVIDAAALRRHFGPALAEPCLAALRAKALDAAAAEDLSQRLVENWPLITARLRPVMLPTARLVAAMTAAGAPTTAAELGIPTPTYRAAIRHARALRDRYTILDLAADAGALDDFAANEA